MIRPSDEYWVHYRVQGHDGLVFEAGPYRDWDEATVHYRDIAGFERIWDARIIPRPTSKVPDTSEIPEL